jgi:2-dehydropantoate 2-reductase
MNILVMGAGAIGSAAGGMLARKGHRVHLVGRPAHMEAVRREGLLISGLWGRHRVREIAAHTSVAVITGEDIDLALIATKTYDTLQAVNAVAPLVNSHTLVASLQNGLGNAEAIAGRVGKERTLAARVMFGADISAPGRVEVTVQGGELMLGNPWGAVAAERIESLADAFSEAGVAALATEDIEGFLWGKLLYNCCLNPLSALLGVSYGRLGEMEPTRQAIAGIINEVFTVAGAQGVKLFWSRPAEYEEVLYDQLLPFTGAHYASMYADLQRGKRTEIDSLNGALVKLGEEKGLVTPYNLLLTWLVQAREWLAPKTA